MENKVKLIKLDNGLTLISDHRPWYTSASVVAYVGVGVKHEQEARVGISHLLEHVIFKGTKNYPTFKDITGNIEGIGGRLDAFTSYDYSAYYAKVPRSQAEVALQMILDLVYNPLLLPEDIDREKTVVYNELRLRYDDPEEYSDLMLAQNLWVKGPLSREVGGTPETVSSITQQDIIELHQYFYRNPNITIVASGAYEEYNLINMLNKIPAQQFDLPFKDMNSEFQVPQRKSITRDTSESYLRLGYPLFNRYSPLKTSAAVFNVLLGVGGSSRLFEEIREKRSLTYDIGSSLLLLKEAGELSIALSTHPDKVEEALGVILKEVDNLREGRVSEKEVARSKAYIKGSFLLSLEDSLRRAFFWGEGYLLDGVIKDVDEEIKNYESVDFYSEIVHLKPYFAPERCCIVSVVPRNT
ncbi:MAG: putative zinc protease [candidate division WS2 bacterium]|uniref:Zinc protease n=1 Tax=Psychracetigena formicireducens TaxID=2986056 RepID=A0A9E2BGH2_PSYF1|nr:putative zinc protease [Candidatus Psychracetigena formicireducens]MBT9145156.1 putative zinc protease [Candidatus Psychracetigena formicireducens]MBT9150154.1 putative zinc protease [Candidatus Psychracetigena formicireducens]